MTNVVVLDAAQTPAARQDPRNLAEVGAGLLDVELAHDKPWFWRVNPGRLDQMDTNRCVLAQLFGNWQDGLERLFPRLTVSGQFVAAERCGFWVNDSVPDGEPAESDSAMTRYAELTEQWRAAIVARREMWR